MTNEAVGNFEQIVEADAEADFLNHLVELVGMSTC